MKIITECEEKLNSISIQDVLTEEGINSIKSSFIVIQNKLKFKRKVFIVLMIFLFISFLFSMSNYFSIIHEELYITLLFGGAFLFLFKALLLNDDIDNLISLINKLNPISKHYCERVVELSNQYPEVNKYRIDIINQGREITWVDLEVMEEYNHDSIKKIQQEELEAKCRLAYFV